MTWSRCLHVQKELYECIDELFSKLKEARAQATAAGQPLDGFELFEVSCGPFLFRLPVSCIRLGHLHDPCLRLRQQAGSFCQGLHVTLHFPTPSRSMLRWGPARRRCRCRPCPTCRRARTLSAPGHTATWATHRQRRCASSWRGLTLCPSGSGLAEPRSVVCLLDALAAPSKYLVLNTSAPSVASRCLCVGGVPVCSAQQWSTLWRICGPR